VHTWGGRSQTSVSQRAGGTAPTKGNKKSGNNFGVRERKKAGSTSRNKCGVGAKRNKNSLIERIEEDLG